MLFSYDHIKAVTYSNYKYQTSYVTKEIVFVCFSVPIHLKAI